MTQVILEVPEAALQRIGKEPAGFARDVYETAVVKWYDERKPPLIGVFWGKDFDRL